MGLGMVAVMTARGYECLLYHRGGGRRPIGESDRPTTIMLECDVNLYCCPAQWSRNSGQWSHRGLHGGKVRQGGPVAAADGKRRSIYSSPEP
jgi:hypothetical protein